ncbi:MAG: hypothetical protein Q9167_003177 [Letrouitia subvulpina]
MAIFSVDDKGKRTTLHARLEVRMRPQQRWLDEWKRNTHLVTARINALDRSVQSYNEDTDSHMIKRGMAYKLFGALIEYGKEYQGMGEVVLDSKYLEAVATVELQVGQKGFHINPRWIDSLGHIAGFIMNANDRVDSRTQVFINHGWEKMRFAEPPQMGKIYRAYNRMQLVEKTSYAGDTYILEGDRIVAIFEGVRFQGVPLRMLDNLLPGKISTASTKPVASNSSTASPSATVVTAPKPPAHLPLPQPQSAKTKSAAGILSGTLGQSWPSLASNELGLNFAPSLFVDNPTVKDLQAPIGGEDIDSQATTHSSSDSSSDDEGQEKHSTSGATSIDLEMPQQAASSSSGRTRACLVTRQVIAEEARILIDELKPSTSLADIGIDSLHSLTIGGKLQELLEVDNAGSIFVECETLQDVEEAVCKALGLGQPISKKPKEPFNHYPPLSPDSSIRQTSLEDSLPQSAAVPSLPPATSILLSGLPQTARLILFLFPDGSGSASSYAAMAPVIDASSVAVYGLNCPWRRTGADMTRLGMTMLTMIARYVVEVQRLLQQQQRQTTNVEIALGGWSAGGILALEAVRQLQQQQSGIVQVGKLILLDSPNPIGLQNPPQRMYDFFDSLGIFGGGKGQTPQWLREHFDAFLRILDEYEPTPLPNAPASLIVYARDGICKDLDGPRMKTRPDDPREMLWLLNNRTDFQADEWACILGRDRLSAKVLDGVNHFTLMDAGPKMGDLGQLVERFLVKEGKVVHNAIIDRPSNALSICRRTE